MSASFSLSMTLVGVIVHPLGMFGSADAVCVSDEDLRGEIVPFCQQVVCPCVSIAPVLLPAGRS